MEALGAKTLIFSADVSDLEQMQRVVAEVEERFGQLHGVIHAAGVVDYAGIIQRRSREATDKVLDPKVKGTLVLDFVLKDSTLDFFVLCSTLGSLLPTVKFGEAGYSAANEFLDAFAYAKSMTRSAYTMTINWTDWQEVGMSAAALKAASHLYSNLAHLDSSTWGSMRPAEGVAVFERALSSRFPRIVISTQELATVLTFARHYKKVEQASANLISTQQLHARPKLKNDYVAPTTETEQLLASILQGMLGIDKVGMHDNFFELGGDSLLLIQLHNRLQKLEYASLALDALFQFPTVGTLAQYLSQQGQEKQEETLLGEELRDRSQRQRAALARQKQMMKEGKIRR
jgi:acyl carrier protein